MDKYPYFLNRDKYSNFYRTSNVNNTGIQRMYNDVYKTYESFHLNKRLLTWREQEKPYDYTMNFVANYPLIKEASIYKNNHLIYHNYYNEKEEKDEYIYQYSPKYYHQSETIEEYHEYKVCDETIIDTLTPPTECPKIQETNNETDTEKNEEENILKLTVTGSSFNTYVGANPPFTYTGEVQIDWGDGTSEIYTGGQLNHTFVDNASTHEIKIIGEVTHLNDGCFAICTNLTSVELPNSVTNIGNFCFYECTNLISIEFPNSPLIFDDYGDYCFYECTSLSQIILNWETSDNIMPYICN